jgi:4'-phosphopantetheinyl transferase
VRLDAGPGFDLRLVDLQSWPSSAQLTWLSEGEQQKAARFVFERDRRRYLAAHTQLRALLSDLSATAPERLEFQEGPFGKPYLQRPAHCVFNLSHSEDVAVVLIAGRGEVGVDVEMLRPMPDALALAERNFSRIECASLRSIEPAQRDQAFLTGWTRKEACLKAIGSGLSIAPDTFTAGLQHEPGTTTIPTPQGVATVTVHSLCHEQRLVIAWAWVEPLTAG